MGFLSINFESFTRPLEQVDAVPEQQRPIDKKADELLRSALSVKASQQL